VVNFSIFKIFFPIRGHTQTSVMKCREDTSLSGSETKVVEVLGKKTNVNAR